MKSFYDYISSQTKFFSLLSFLVAVRLQPPAARCLLPGMNWQYARI